MILGREGLEIITSQESSNVINYRYRISNLWCGCISVDVRVPPPLDINLITLENKRSNEIQLSIDPDFLISASFCSSAISAASIPVEDSKRGEEEVFKVLTFLSGKGRSGV